MKNKNDKPWLNGRIPYGYWKEEEHRKKALKWLIEEKLDIFNNNHKLTIKDFVDNGFGTLITLYFGNSINNVLKFLYPENYMDIYIKIIEIKIILKMVNLG